MNGVARRTAIVAVAAAALYLATAATIYAGQRLIVFRPDATRPDVANARVPGLAEVTVPLPDGTKLLAWWLPPPQGARTILYFHGNGGNIGYRASRMRAFAAADLGVLMPEYPGYGGNGGTPTETSLFETAEAAVGFLGSHGIGERSIAIYGESLGTAVAARAAAGRNVAAVVLESPFTSMPAMARLQYWFLPVDLLTRDRFDTLALMPRIRSPLMVAFGERDRLVPPAMGRTLAAAAPGHATTWVAPDGGHEDLASHGLMRAATEFVRQAGREDP